MAREWSRADRISDRIVDIFNDELARMRTGNAIDGLQLLVGWLLAFKALQRTMPPADAHPATLWQLEHAINGVLHEILKM